MQGNRKRQREEKKNECWSQIEDKKKKTTQNKIPLMVAMNSVIPLRVSMNPTGPLGTLLGIVS